jgi:alanine-glyoxylate transaminase/serine-glyoxylate transaminase/serine-pyruvate transaminase
VSQKALEAAHKAQSRRCYFDFADMARANKDGFFPYTPPLHLLRGLRASLDLLFAEGLEHVFQRHHRLAEGVRKAVHAWGLKLCAAEPRWHSDTVSAIFLPDGFDSNAFVRNAYNAYGLSLGIGLSKVAGRVFRIGHLGDLNELMVLSALSGVELVLRDQGVPFTAGSGVAAAIEHFHRTQRAQLAKAA